MNKMREILRLALDTNMSHRLIGRTVGASHNTVRHYRMTAVKKRLDWTTVASLDDTALEALFHTSRHHFESKRLPDFSQIHKELQLRKDVTRALLWEEYCLANPDDAYSLSQFNHYLREYIGKLDLVMRQTHLAGECVYVDFAGGTASWTDRETGQDHDAQIFVGVLGCSNYTFAYATASQSTWDWIDAHNRMLKFFSGVPKVIVPDNLKAAVTCAGREPELNRIYLELARHYGVVVVPARVRHPRDKAKAEVGVQFVSRWILARLRHRRFFSLAELNAAIAELLTQLNERRFKRLPGCRRSRFLELDKPMLRPLPAQPFEYAEWIGRQKIGLDYHAYIREHYYSVPHALVHEQVEARITNNTVEIFHKSRRVASHVRSNVIGGHTTLSEHQPATHRHYAEQSPEGFLEWAQTIGVAAVAAVQYQFDNRPHTLLGMQACSSLQRLSKDYGAERFEAACCRAQAIGSLTVKSIRSILQRKLSGSADADAPLQVSLPLHHNVRGARYYSTGGN